MSANPTARSAGIDYYDGPEIADVIFDALKQAGVDIDPLDIDELAALDEFHALGRPATIAMAELCGVPPDSRLLDLGAGIGGPARLLAQRYRARVSAVDATARFCRASERLCQATGLSERVEVVHADALQLPFAPESFDIAWSQALVQSVPDKPALLAEARRVLVSGGRLALFEVVGGPGGPVRLPVPWASHPSESFLVSGEELRGIAEDAGFQPVAWRQGADVLAAVTAAASDLPAPGPDRGIGLALLMPDFEQRMAGVAQNLAERRIELAAGVLVAR
jgi:sarcosine/dimethylglycine N-methyltransferase